MHVKELLKITKFARKFDKATGKFTFNIRYKTRTTITPRTIKVGEAFGLGVDKSQEHVIFDNIELKIGPQDIVYVTGDSGSGKSVLLRALKKDLRSKALDIASINLSPSKPLIDTVGKTLEQGLELLSRVGLNDAFLFIRRYDQLSDGQKYRYRIAKLIETGKQYWIMDEFCSTLDRDTAKIVAFNVQKIARQEGKAVLAATTHTDLFEDLKPTVHIQKRFGREVAVEYFPNKINKTCSLIQEMRIEKGKRRDYEKLAGFHYRDAKGLVVHQKIFVLKRGDENAGVIVYSSPPIAVFGRRKAFGRKLTIQEVNRDLTLISRVIVHPKYRTIGLGVKLVGETLPLAGKPYVETTAVMARYNPFFERAGMTKIAESTPNPKILSAVEKLKALGFNPVFLTSETTNLQKLGKMAAHEVQMVRNAFKQIPSGIYGKRIMSVHQAYLNREEFTARVDAANLEKMVKMLHVLGFLIQTKVYLIWKNPTTSTEVTTRD